jgi:hypothetical protein
LKDLQELIDGLPTYMAAFKEDYTEIAIQALEQTKWIPCSERLPKKEKKTYWVCTDTEYQCECRWTNNRFGLGEGEWGWSMFDTPLSHGCHYQSHTEKGQNELYYKFSRHDR